MTWTLNGIDPRVAYGLLVDAPGGWRSAPPKARTTAVLPGVPGARLLDAAPQEGVKRLSITGTVRGTSSADAQAKLDLLIALVSERPLTVIFNDQPTRFITCELEGFQVTPPAAAIIARDIPISINLVAYDPFTYDVTPQSINFAAATAMPQGTGPVRPVITITGGATNPVFTLKNSGAAPIGTLGLTVTFPNTDTVIIDCAKKTITRNGVSHLEYLTSGDFFVIDPLLYGVYRASSWPTLEGSGLTVNANCSYKKAWRS